MTNARTNAELTEAAATGLRWIALARVVTEVLLLGSMIVLARLIPPSAFGMFAVAVIVQELAVNAPSEGVGSALVQRKTVDRAHLQGGLALTLVGGLILGALILVLAVLAVDPLYGHQTAVLVELTAPWCLLGAVAAVPMAILRRELDFRKLSILAMTQSIARAGASIVLAIMGYDGAALVWGGLAGMVAMTVMAVFFAPLPLPRWRWPAARELLSYGGPAALASLSWVGFRNGDYAIIGARLGAAQAGYYWRGFQLAVEYQGKISAVMAQMAFPVLARTTDRDSMFVLRRRMVGLLTVVIFPLLTGLVILAPEIVPWVFGPAWQPAVLPTQILAGAGAATVVIDHVGAMFMASGRAKALLGYGVAHFAVYVGAVLIASTHGLTAVSIAAVSVHFAFLLVAYEVLLRGRPEKALTLLWDDVSPAAVSCLVLAATCVPLELVLRSGSAPPPVHLLLVAPAAALAYLATLRVLFPTSARDLATLVRRVLPERPMRALARRRPLAGRS